MADVRQPPVGIQRVFISSTSQDLQAHRKAVHDVLERMGQFAVDMAQFGTQGNSDAVAVSAEQIASANLFIGIVAWRYGYVPVGETRSVTHLEYLVAKSLGLPCFLFFAASETEQSYGPRALFPAKVRDLDHSAQLVAFRAELQREQVVDYFTTPDDLAKKVATAIHGYLLRQQESALEVNLAGAEALYRQHVVQAYRSLRFSGFTQGDLYLDEVPLESIFVRLRLTLERIWRAPEGLVTDALASKKDQRLPEQVLTTQEPITLAQALDKPLLLVGEPGAGKSTLLRWLAVTFAKGTQRKPEYIGQEAPTDRLPILVELGHLPNDYLQGDGGKIPIWNELVPMLLTEQPIFAGTPSALFQQALLEGRCLLLFDGLDEVANRQARVRLARSLAELPRLYPGTTIVISSRPAGLSEGESELRPTFQLCEIQRFTPEDLHRFVHFWYALDRNLTAEEQERAAAALIAHFQTTPGTLSLATTPLLATILLLIWRRDGALPERRTDLYERCCRVLVEEWEQSHDVPYRGLFARLDWGQHLLLLAPIAYAIHSQERRTSLNRQELLPLLEQALLDMKLCANTVDAAQESSTRWPK